MLGIHQPVVYITSPQSMELKQTLMWNGSEFKNELDVIIFSHICLASQRESKVRYHPLIIGTGCCVYLEKRELGCLSVRSKTGVSPAASMECLSGISPSMKATPMFDMDQLSTYFKGFYDNTVWRKPEPFR